MRLLLIVLTLSQMFLPFISKSGTNIGILVNTPCGPVINDIFYLVFDDGTVVEGKTDADGEWKGVGPVSTKVTFRNSFVWLTRQVIDRRVYFHAFSRQCLSG